MGQVQGADEHIPAPEGVAVANPGHSELGYVLDGAQVLQQVFAGIDCNTTVLGIVRAGRAVKRWKLGRQGEWMFWLESMVPDSGRTRMSVPLKNGCM